MGTQADAAAVRASEAEAASAAGAAASSAEETRALTTSLHHAQQTNALLKQQVEYCQSLLEQAQTPLNQYRWMLRGATEQYDVPDSYTAFDLGFESLESTAARRATEPATEETATGREGRSLWELLRYVVQSELHQQFVDPDRPDPPPPVRPGPAPPPRLHPNPPTLPGVPLPCPPAELPDAGEVSSERISQDAPSHVHDGASFDPRLRDTCTRDCQ